MNSQQTRAIRLIPIRELTPGMKMQIRTIRNNPDVRRWMYNDHVIGEVEHQRWLDIQAESTTNLYFGVVESDNLLGVVSANRIDYRNERCDWAFYLSDKARGGLGSCLEFSFVDFVFNTLKMQKLNCEVIEGNEAVIGLHRRFLFKEEGFRKSEIARDGRRRGIHFLGLTRDEWIEGREQVHVSIAEKLKKFEIEIQT